MEYGYDGDQVKEAFKTFYLNVEQYDATQKQSIKSSMESNFADAQALSFVTITHSLTDDYYIMTAHIKALDNADNVAAVSETDLLPFVSEGTSSLSISAIEDTLLSNEFVKN